MSIQPSGQLSDHIDRDIFGIIAGYVSDPEALAEMGAVDRIPEAYQLLFKAYCDTPSLVRYTGNAKVLYPGTDNDLEKICGIRTTLLYDSRSFENVPKMDPNDPFDISILDRHSTMVEAADFIAMYEEIEKQIPEAKAYNQNHRILDPILKAKALQFWMYANIDLLSRITELDLSDINLKSLPKEIGLLTELRSLDLADNELLVLPDSIGNLTELRDLSLLRNRLSSVPDSIGNLTKLKRLILSNNKIKILPDSIEKLTELRRLGLSDNLLQELPKNIGNLIHLDRLNISNNKIEQLPLSMENIIFLTGLFINNTSIDTEHLPDYLKAAVGP